MITLRLYGPMDVATESGSVASRLGIKTQALVALVATAPDMVRSRVWLQDKLWSDRDPRQASASLRQALYRLRGALGDAAQAIISNRHCVGFEPASVRILAPTSRDGEFLEGMDICDPEFEDWLTLQRMDRSSDAAATAPATVTKASARPMLVEVSVDDDVTPDLRHVVLSVADMFAEALDNRALVRVRLGVGPEPVDLKLDLTAFSAGSAVLRGQLLDTCNFRHLWSQNLSITSDLVAPIDRAGFAGLVNSGIDSAIAAQLRSAGTSETAAVPVHKAVQKILGFREEDISSAEALLMEVDGFGATPLAWRIFLRMVQCVERTRAVDSEFLNETDEMVRSALMQDNRNPMVLAASSHACLNVLNRPNDALLLAKKAVAISPHNPFAFDALSGSLISCGDSEASYKAACRALFLAQSTQGLHFFEMGHCLAAIATERLDEARATVRKVAATAPWSRPALRYLAILESHAGVHDAAENALDRLRKVEPGFDPVQIESDPDYPVASFRKSAMPRNVLRPFY